MAAPGCKSICQLIAKEYTLVLRLEKYVFDWNRILFQANVKEGKKKGGGGASGSKSGSKGDGKGPGGGGGANTAVGGGPDGGGRDPIQ